MSSTEQNTTEQIVTKKKKIKVLPFIIIGIIVLVVVAALAVLVVNGVVTASTEKKVQEQLDLGERYLQELDYEQAIVAYTTAIEIDPKNVDAYLGLADVYVAMDDYDRAIEVLEQGYDETEDDKIKDRIEELQEEMEEKSEEEQESADVEDESSEAEEGDSFSGEVVDGIYHNPYYEYDLSEDSLTYLREILEEVEVGNGETVAQGLDYQKISEIITETENDTISRELVQYEWCSGDGEMPGNKEFANILLDDMKVHIYCATIEYTVVGVYILPKDDGEGHILYHFQDSDHEGYVYSAINCVDGVPNGEFNVQYNETGGYINYQGRVVNGLLDGEFIITYYYEGIESLKDIMTFDMGKTRYSNVVVNEEGYINVEMATHTWFGEPYEEAEKIDTQSMDVAMRFLDGTFTLDAVLGFPVRCSVTGTEVDGGMRYYEW